jgi:fructoselysine 3-epimerase
MNYSLENAIRLVFIAGFDGIEIWGGRPHAYRFDLREHEFRHCRALLDDLGMQAPAFTPAQFLYPTSLCSPIKKIYRDSIQYFKDSIETAVRIGSQIICAMPGHTLNDQLIDDGWNRLAEGLIEICEYAAHYDILIGIQPANEYETDLVNTTVQALEMVEQLDCDNFGVIYNNAHAFIAGEETIKTIENLSDRLIHVHLSDNHGKSDQHLIPGRGLFDFQEMAFALSRIGYEGFISVELGMEYSVNPDAAAAESREFLETIDW